jgi:GT2 family glycosyltransferase
MTDKLSSIRPTISIVVPTRNRPAQLKRCLDALVRIDTSNPFEVVVVDDGGTPEVSTQDVIALKDVEILRQDRAGPAAARNAGATAASGDYIAFVDDDCEVAHGWLAALEDALAANPRAAVAGRVVNALPHDAYAMATQELIDYARDWYESNDRVRRYATSNNLAMRRNDFLEVGGFDARFALAAGEDRDFSRRWLASGRPIVDAPDALVTHAHRLSFSGFLRQHFNYGRGAFTFHETSPESRLAALGFYAGLVASPLHISGESRLKRSALVGLLASSQVATAVGYLWQATSEHRRSSTSPAERVQ